MKTVGICGRDSGEHAVDVLEAQPKILKLLDELDLLDRAFIEDPVARNSTGGLRQEPTALVIPDGIDGDPGKGRHLTDLELRHLGILLLTLESGPESMIPIMHTPRRVVAVLLYALGATAACNSGRPEMTTTDLPPIACRLDALSPAQRAREGELLQQHLAVTLEVRERDDGFSFRYPADVAQFALLAEFVGLEHLCCPFLDFRLEWAGAEENPWLHITGGTRVKEFVKSTFTRP